MQLASCSSRNKVDDSKHGKGLTNKDGIHYTYILYPFLIVLDLFLQILFAKIGYWAGRAAI